MQDDALGDVGRARGRAPARRRAAAATCPSTWAETISGSVESGRPTPMRTRAKSGVAEPGLSDFRPLWPARPPPTRVRMSPNGRSISSCRTSTRSSVDLQRAARGAGGAARPRSCRSAAAAPRRAGRRPGAPLGQQAVELLLRASGRSQRRAERVGDLEADVVRRARVARARVAEPDDEPVDGRGPPTTPHGAPATRSEASAAVGRLAGLGGALGASSPSPTTPVSVSMLLGLLLGLDVDVRR